MTPPSGMKAGGRSWRRKIGNRLIGAIGKTDYSGVGHGLMPTVSGTWTR